MAEEVAQSTESAKKGEDEEDEAPEEPEEPEDDVDEDEDEDEDDEDGGKKSKKGKKGKKAKKGGSKGGMAAMAAIVKKLGAMWASAQAEEKATFEAEAAKQKENYAAAMKAWYESDSYKSFAAEVDEWQQTEEAKTTKKPGKSFRAWRRKKLQGKRLAQRQADRERAKAEKMAAKLKAKAEKPGKKAKAEHFPALLCFDGSLWPMIDPMILRSTNMHCIYVHACQCFQLSWDLDLNDET